MVIGKKYRISHKIGYSPDYFNGILLQQTFLIFMKYCDTNCISPPSLWTECGNSSKINNKNKDLQAKRSSLESMSVTADTITIEIFLWEQKLQ